ncbi:MAG: type II CAAX endopeptidase family protein [Candidatus Nanopelagicales bacterium]
MNIRTSPLVEMTKEATRPTRWWLGWIVALVIILAGAFAGGALGGLVFSSPELKQFQELCIFGVTAILLFLWVRFKEGRPFSSVGFRGRNPVGKLILGVVIGALMMTAAVLVGWATGQLGTGLSVHANVGADSLVFILLLLLVFFVQASTEEAVTRGYMLQIGGRDINGWVAILGSSVIFAVIHPGLSPIALLNIVLYAVFACFVALGQGSLWLIAGIHIGWNYFQGNIYGIPVSGNAHANSLFAFGPTSGSNELLNGGSFGLEASLIGSAILVVALVIGVVSYRRAEAGRLAEATVPDTANA